MRPVAIVTLVVPLATIAHAEERIATDQAPRAEAKQPPPDEIADVESREANLESKEPRKGLTFAAAVGGGLMLGSGIGVSRGPALSLRLGHVATRKTVITFELVGSTGLHRAAVSGPTLYDNNFGLYAGAQRYTSPSFWLRAAGGLTFLAKNAMSDGSGGESSGGIGGLLGGGLDVARWGYLVLGFESFGMGSLTSDGIKLQLGLSLGLTYY